MIDSQAPLYSEPAEADAWTYYSPEELEAILSDGLIGRGDLAYLPVKTRSKVAKSLVAEILGFSVPRVFPKTQPRLPHPNVDVYVQQSRNLQIWNSEVDAARRYVIIGLDAAEQVHAVRVIAGADLANFDTTGKLTSKFQASRRINGGSRLVSRYDTEYFTDLLRPSPFLYSVPPTERPRPGTVVTIAAAFEALTTIVGQTFHDPGMTQERLRGEVLHRASCDALGLTSYADHGQFPDILSQVIEVKLQLAGTVDLGLELPSSSTPIASLDGRLSARDVRYAIFYGTRLDANTFQITSLVMTTGADFFEEFRQFGGIVTNKKLQLTLPMNFFD